MRGMAMVPLVLMLAAGCAAAAADLGFERVDSSDDDFVSRAEYGESVDDMNIFARYDDDDDQRLSREEYREAVDDDIEGDAYFDGFDRNRDGQLTKTEYNDGLFGIFDRNHDGQLSEDEFENLAASLAFEM